MKIIAVVGTGSGCGKTTVACRILQAIPGLGAVKISPRDGASLVEWGAGRPGKDTDLYVRSGAVPVARIIGPRESVAASWAAISSAFKDRPGVVIEGASALDLPGARLVIFIAGAASEAGREHHNRALALKADVLMGQSSPGAPWRQGWDPKNWRPGPVPDVELADTVRAFLAGSSTE